MENNTNLIPITQKQEKALVEFEKIIDKFAGYSYVRGQNLPEGVKQDELFKDLEDMRLRSTDELYDISSLDEVLEAYTYWYEILINSKTTRDFKENLRLRDNDMFNFKNPLVIRAYLRYNEMTFDELFHDQILHLFTTKDYITLIENCDNIGIDEEVDFLKVILGSIVGYFTNPKHIDISGFLDHGLGNIESSSEFGVFFDALSTLEPEMYTKVHSMLSKVSKEANNLSFEEKYGNVFDNPNQGANANDDKIEEDDQDNAFGTYDEEFDEIQEPYKVLYDNELGHIDHIGIKQEEKETVQTNLKRLQVGNILQANEESTEEDDADEDDDIDIE